MGKNGTQKMKFISCLLATWVASDGMPGRTLSIKPAFGLKRRNARIVKPAAKLARFEERGGDAFLDGITLISADEDINGSYRAIRKNPDGEYLNDLSFIKQRLDVLFAEMNHYTDNLIHGAKGEWHRPLYKKEGYGTGLKYIVAHKADTAHDGEEARWYWLDLDDYVPEEKLIDGVVGSDIVGRESEQSISNHALCNSGVSELILKETGIDDKNQVITVKFVKRNKKYSLLS